MTRLRATAAEIVVIATTARTRRPVARAQVALFLVRDEGEPTARVSLIQGRTDRGGRFVRQVLVAQTGNTVAYTTVRARGRRLIWDRVARRESSKGLREEIVGRPLGRGKRLVIKVAMKIGITLAGRVVDPDGYPVAGACVGVTLVGPRRRSVPQTPYFSLIRQ